MKAIRHVATLDYYDGPILFEARDRIGGHYLAVAIDAGTTEPRFAVVGVSPSMLVDFRSGAVDLQHVMVVSGAEDWYVARPSGTMDEFLLERQTTAIVDSVHLPTGTYKLDPPLGTPNLFDFATKELSQDAFICWLIAWSACDQDSELRHLGRHFVDALLRHKRDQGIPDYDGLVADVEVFRQKKNIDVLARVNSKFVVLIEDKTDSNPHGDQLTRYRQAILNGEIEGLGRVSEENLTSIYLKTGNQSRAMTRMIEEGKSRYRVFDRNDFLTVLDGYRGDNAIVVDFRRRLQSVERDTQSFRMWIKDGRRSWASWQGLYRELEERLFSTDHAPRWNGWDYVANRAGGFLGFWWQPSELPADCPAYLQLERAKLCFKLDAKKCPGKRSEVGRRWRGQISLHERVKPARVRPGNTMTLAELEDGWLRFRKDGVLDIDRTVASLREAERILVAAASP